MNLYNPHRSLPDENLWSLYALESHSMKSITIRSRSACTTSPNHPMKEEIIIIIVDMRTFQNLKESILEIYIIIISDIFIFV